MLAVVLLGALINVSVPGYDNDVVQACMENSALAGIPCELPAGRFRIGPRTMMVTLGNPFRIMGLQAYHGPYPVVIRGAGRGQTVLEMSGDWYGTDGWMLGCFEQTGLEVSDLTLDGSGRTGGYHEQQHLLQLYYGCKDVVVNRVDLVHPALAPSGGGDCIRLVGGYDDAARVENVTIQDINASPCDRSVVGIQRGVRDVTIDTVHAVGTGDQDIDFEPTGFLSPEDRPRDVTIRNLTAIRPEGGLSVSLVRCDRCSLGDSTIEGTLFILSTEDTEISNVRITSGPYDTDATVTVRRSTRNFQMVDSVVTRTGPPGLLLDVSGEAEGYPDAKFIRSTLVQSTQSIGLACRSAWCSLEDSVLFYTGPAGYHRDAVAVVVEQTVEHVRPRLELLGSTTRGPWSTRVVF